MNTRNIGEFLDQYAVDDTSEQWKNRPVPSTHAYDYMRIAKLMEEVGELLASDENTIAGELADCAILLHAIAWSNGVNLDSAIDDKLAELAERWKE